MNNHIFLLEPKLWLGEGVIQLNMVEEELGFCTRWTVFHPNAQGETECLQEIQIKGVPDIMHNKFIFSPGAGPQFGMQLENEAIGRIAGTGLITDSLIAWEFRIKEIGFEGFELYEKQQDDSYIMRAEFATGDQFRTLIRGRIWQKT